MRQGDVIGERFELERLAGSGGMGEVFRARDRASSQAVAVKLLLPECALDHARFLREAELLAELAHPAIVRYVAHGLAPSGEPYLAMEWLSGEDLQSRLQRAPLTVGEAVALGARVAEALSVAHARGAVHRDLKPSNLFLIEQDVRQVKVLDFGIAQLRHATRVTKTGVVLGTPGYMAPEQAQASATIDARADLFALGCVLFEGLTGAPLFSGGPFMVVLAKLLYAEAPRLGERAAGIPEGLDVLVARMLAKDPAERPRDAEEVRAVLEALETEAVPPTVAAPSARREPRTALTGSERRMLSLLLLGGAPAVDVHMAPTLSVTALSAFEQALRQAVEGHGGDLSLLTDGSVLVSFTDPSALATDLATQAARAALAVRALCPDRPMALATGHAEVTTTLPMGEVIERASQRLAKLAEAAPARERGTWPIALDDVTAGLLDARFEVVEAAQGFELSGERELAEGARTLLGKPTPCVGRDWELSTLEALFAECVEEPAARAVLVTAPAGRGKSRLANELMRRIRERSEGTEIWLGRVDSLRAGSAFGLLGQVLRGVLSIQEGEPLEARRQKLLARVGTVAAESEKGRIAEFLGEIVATPFPEEQSARLRAARRDARLMGEQMCAAFVDFLLAETAAHPVLLVLEDLHWGDLPTVQFLDAALRDAPRKSWMMLALARPEVRQRFPQLWAARNLQEMRLSELSRKASARLARQVLGDRARADTIERIVALAEGNAFYLEELIRAVAEGKGAALPETVLAMVEARLSGLESEARRVLRAASVFGEVFWQGGLAELLGSAIPPARIEERLGTLVKSELLTRRTESRFPGETEFAFRHALLREGAYAMLTGEDRGLGHRLAAAWLERAGESDPMVLAEHFERGGEPAPAVGFYRRAAEQALRGQDCEVAIARAERAIRCGAEGEAYTGLTLLISESLSHTCDYAQSLVRVEEVLALAPRGSRHWCWAIGGKFILSGLLGAMNIMMEALGALQGVEPEPEGAANFVASLALTFPVLLSMGQFELCEASFARMEQLGSPLMGQDPWVRGWIEWASAVRSYVQGDTWTALTLHKRAEASFAEAEDQRWMSLARVYQGMCLLLLGAHAEGQEFLEAFLESRDATPILVATAKLFIAIGKADRGAHEEAHREATTLAATMPAEQDPGGGTSLLLLVARIQLHRRELAAAEQKALTAIEVFSARPRDRALALTTLADIRLAQRRPAEALATVEQAIAALQLIPPAYRAGAYLPLIHAEALFATGDHEGARAAITSARAELLARADQIGDPRYRTTFLENVPENARTLARERAWLAEDAASSAPA